MPVSVTYKKSAPVETVSATSRVSGSDTTITAFDHDKYISVRIGGEVIDLGFDDVAEFATTLRQMAYSHQ